MPGILTTLCGGLVLIAGWQYRHRLAGLLGLLMLVLFGWAAFSQGALTVLLMLLPLLAAEEMIAAMSANWQRYRNQTRKAA